MTRFAWQAITVLVASVIGLVLLIGGPAGVGYLLLLALTTLPGLPLGFALFGRRHAGGWIAGMLLGYAITSFAWWAVVFFQLVSTVAFVAAWLVACAVAWILAAVRKRQAAYPLVVLPPWSRRDTAALAFVLLLVPALMGLPFARLGSSDDAGTRRYRAYFIADFVWHTALTAELAKHEQPPRNPYFAAEPVHYYWTYFRVPATLSSVTGVDVQRALKLNALGAALLFIAALYLAAWVAMPGRPRAIAFAVALTILATSAEGLAAVVDLIRRGRPLSELRDLNIDAIAAWAFKGLRIDDLPRAMWYTPQHSMAYALGLLAVPVAIVAGVRARPAAIALAGLALGASLAFNPLVGAVFSAVYGLTVLFDAVRTRARVVDVVTHGLAVVPVLLAFAWCQLNQVSDGAVGLLHFGFWGPARNATVITFLLSFGPILLPMAVGLLPARQVPFGRAFAAAAGVALSVLLMHLVTLTVDEAWVGFRAGHLFFVFAPVLVARGFVRFWDGGLKPAGVMMTLLVLVTGLPTTIIDVYNAQDVENLKMGPGFHWTVTVTRDQHEALDWIKTNTALDAVVQAEPVVRGRETWSLIPTFAERRMAAGNAIPLLTFPDDVAKMDLVRQIYSSGDSKASWELAKRLGIDYLYADSTERAAYPAVAKFDAHPEYFALAFQNTEASVYAVK